MSRAGESHVRPGPRLWVILGAPASLVVGFVLAFIALCAGFLHEGGYSEFGYCSERGGMGNYGTVIPGKRVVYLDEGWGGFPPRGTCSVYLVDADRSLQPLSAEEALRRSPPPHRLVARESLPGNGGYVWILGLLLAPIAAWAAVALGTGIKRRREWRWYSEELEGP